MKKTMLKVVMLSVITTLLISCYPDSNTDIDDLDTVSTVSIDADFNTAPKTAMILWEVAELEGDDGNNVPYHGEIDKEILNTTLDNLVDLYGVENVYIFSETETPSPVPSNSQVTVFAINGNDPQPFFEAGVVASVVLRQNTEVGWVYPGYPWWGCWYCWYTPIPVVVDYEVGTVIISMMDHRQNGNDLAPSWMAFVRGLPSDSNSFNGDRTVSGIDQAFEQSPFLK